MRWESRSSNMQEASTLSLREGKAMEVMREVQDPIRLYMDGGFRFA